MSLEKQLMNKKTEQSAQTENIAVEVLNRFTRMLDHIDFQPQLNILNIGRMQFARKNMALKELRAMYVGLWKLALNSSFPNDAMQLLDKFLDSNEIKSKAARCRADAFRNLCLEYVKLLELEGDTNFINVAILICQHIGQAEQENSRHIPLQLALDMRFMYRNIFDKLI